MNIKKGLSYVAFGFLFALVDFNLTLNGTSINITPDFIGWILFFLAFDKLGTYVEGKKFLKPLSLILIILTAAQWVLDIAKPELNVSILSTAAGILAVIYYFILFGCLEKLARDYGSEKEGTLRTLKYINIVLYILLLIFALLFSRTPGTAYALLFALVGVLALVAAVVTAVVLFRLRKEIHTKVDAAEASGTEE